MQGQRSRLFRYETASLGDVKDSLENVKDDLSRSAPVKFTRGFQGHLHTHRYYVLKTLESARPVNYDIKTRVTPIPFTCVSVNISFHTFARFLSTFGILCLATVCYSMHVVVPV